MFKLGIEIEILIRLSGWLKRHHEESLGTNKMFDRKVLYASIEQII